jgi:hypothetical protein
MSNAVAALEPMCWPEKCGPRGECYIRYMVQVRLSDGSTCSTGLRGTAEEARNHARYLVKTKAQFGPGLRR